MMKRTLLFAAVLAAGILISWTLLASNQEKGGEHPDVDYSISCMECHQEETPEIYNEWKSSKHGLMDYGCYMCHGDGEEEFYAHPGTERCTGCHSALHIDFSETPAKNCYDCHKGHSLKFHDK